MVFLALLPSRIGGPGVRWRLFWLGQLSGRLRKLLLEVLIIVQLLVGFALFLTLARALFSHAHTVIGPSAV